MKSRFPRVETGVSRSSVPDAHGQNRRAAALPLPQIHRRFEELLFAMDEFCMMLRNLKGNAFRESITVQRLSHLLADMRSIVSEFLLFPSLRVLNSLDSAHHLRFLFVPGQGGYSNAYKALGLVLRDVDTNSGHWHYW